MVRPLLTLGSLVLLFGFGATAAYAVPTYKMVINPNDVQALTPSDPAGAIKSTRELIAAGKMDDAIHHLETYVLQHPYEIAPRRFLGDLYVRVGELDKAQSEYEAILKLSPGDKETHNRLGTVYAVRDHVDEAIAQFTAALPGTDSVNDLVALHQRRGDLASYKKDVDRIAAEYPTDPAIQGEMGQVYNALNQPYLASVYFKRALDTDPQDLTSLNGLGLAYLNLHDYPNAINEFKMCLAVDPTVYPCQNNLGATELEASNYAAAKIALDRAYALAPERAETFVNYGYLADANMDWHAAVTDYAKAIATWPYIREAYIDLGIAYEDHKLYALAQEALVKGIASVPDDGRMHYLLGRAYEMQGDTADALAQFKLAAAGSDPTAVRIGQEHFAALSAGNDKNPQ